MAMVFVMVVALLTLVAAKPASAAITHVQTAANSDNTATTGTSYSVAFSSNNTAGNTIIAAFYFGSGSYTPTCSDTRGNTYTVATEDYSYGYDHEFGICYASNIAAGPNTVSIAWGGTSHSYRHLIVHEYSGLAPSNPVDVMATNTTNLEDGTDDASSTSALTRYDGDLIFGAAFDDGNGTGLTSGTGFTSRNTIGSVRMLTEDRIQATGGSPTAATFTMNSNNGFHAQMVAFRAIGGTAASLSSGIQYQQSHARHDQITDTTQQSWFVNPNRTGNTIVATIAASDDTTFTCTDTDGNTYTTVVYTWHAAESQSFGICYATVTAVSPAQFNNVTVTFGQSTSWRTLIVTEYSGIATSQPVDAYAQQSGTSSTPSSGSATTTRDGDLIYGAMVNDSGSTDSYQGAGFTKRLAAQNDLIVIEDKIQSSAGSVAATFNNPAGNDWVAQMVAFAPATSNASTVSAVIDSSVTFSVATHAGACNGVSQTAGVSSSSTAIALGHISISANVVAAQDLHVVSNAGSGASVFARWSGAPSDGNGHTLASIAATNASPGSFSSAGTEAVGYTSSDSTLGIGTADRFTNPSAQWSRMTTTNAEVQYAPGAADTTTCIAYQVGVGPSTPAAAYSTTVIYTAVPSF